MKGMTNQNNFPPADVKNQLDKILASSLFIQSLRQCRFLQYVVEETLSGNTDRLKGYSIAVEVFDRDETFDPAIDSIVRVEAGRLRSKLREYYQTEGIDDAIRIELPKGKYSPVFNCLDNNRVANDSSNIDRSALALSIAVLPLRALSNDIEQHYFSDGMTDAIINSLAKKAQIKVISLTSVMRFKNTDKSLKMIAEELNVSHVLEGTVLYEGDSIRVTAQLIEASTDTHLWAESYEREFTSIFALQRCTPSAPCGPTSLIV
jgi:adenylate cyclase